MCLVPVVTTFTPIHICKKSLGLKHNLDSVVAFTIVFNFHFYRTYKVLVTGGSTFDMSNRIHSGARIV